MIHRALWTKPLREGTWLLVACCLLLFAFHWIHVWIVSQIAVRQMRFLLRHMPDLLRGFFPVPPEVLAAPAGHLALAYDSPLVTLAIGIWAIGRASDSVSGEIGRGTMEVLLAQPVRRTEVLLLHGAVTVVGLAALCLAGWLGTCAGLAAVELESEVSPRIFLAAASNLFSLGFLLAGLTTLVSSADRYRARTIGIVVGVFVVQMVIKLVAVSVPSYAWCKSLTFLTLSEPQVLAHRFWPEVLAASAARSWTMLLEYNGTLVAIGLVCHALAVVIFRYRDLPAPL